MKEIHYLSPTSIKLWDTDPQEFYLNYLSDNRPPRFPQTQPMSIGSSFDAYVKSHLYEGLFGKGHNPKYDFTGLFEAQVEPQHRDWALEHGKYVFGQYQSAGCLADLMSELQRANGQPRFEFDVRGAVHGYREGNTAQIHEVTMLGKPDVTFTNHAGHPVILDFKVNGYCSNWPPSPMPGYIKLRSAGKSDHGIHKHCQPMMVHGMMINVGTFLENQNAEWAAQLAIYAWLMGEPIGSKFITAIDQIVCDKSKGVLPQIRIAEHRGIVSEAFQKKLYDKAAMIWEVVHSDWIFRDMTQEDSAARCKVLDGVSEALKGDGSVNDNWFAAVTRG